MQTFRHLSATDAAFLYLETPEMPMHVASLFILDPPAEFSGDFYEVLKAHLAKRIHISPIFQRRVETMPFDITVPVWVDCVPDLDYHVRHVILPKPGTLDQVKAYVARLHSSLLDRSRPLWEIYLFEGLESGEYAVYSKVHHSALDGQGSIEMVKALLDITPVPREVRASRHRLDRDMHFGVAEMIQAALANGLHQAVRTVKIVPPALRNAVSYLRSLRQEAKEAPEGTGDRSWRRFFAPRTPLNVTITNQRVFGTLSLPLAEVKAIGKSVDATINDMVMAICAGGLRRYLKETATLPKEPLVGLMPMSLRDKGDDEMTNLVSGLPVSLHTNVPDPLKRMSAIRESLASVKRGFGHFKDVMTNDFPFLGMPWILSALVSFYGRARLAESLPSVGNVAVSNVMGPAMPLYYAGARVKCYYPISIVTHGCALNITVVSYNGSIDFGFVACRRAMPDMKDFVEDMRAAYEDLKEAIDRHLRKAAETQPVAAAAGKAGKAIAGSARTPDSAAPRKGNGKAAATKKPRPAPRKRAAVQVAPATLSSPPVAPGTTAALPRPSSSSRRRPGTRAAAAG
ncbi:MAG TPA: wax ester/triacylglycerol synthase family O-acyltransferase [Rhodocyclaceae bacterium]|nr:wax ester/triacylglycerol synthase family O-acyltransferase [Rhodocyclaceae bacterium]